MLVTSLFVGLIYYLAQVLWLKVDRADPLHGVIAAMLVFMSFNIFYGLLMHSGLHPLRPLSDKARNLSLKSTSVAEYAGLDDLAMLDKGLDALSAALGEQRKEIYQLRQQFVDEQQYKTNLIKLSPDMLLVYNKEGVLLETWANAEHPLAKELAKQSLMASKVLVRSVVQEIFFKLKLVCEEKSSETMECRLDLPEKNSFYALRFQALDASKALVMIRDITEAKRTELELRYNSLHDSLTGLASRQLLTERLQENLTAFERQLTKSIKQHFALILLDLDHFKRVNDSLGYIGGDELLVEIARRLKRSLRQHDVVARLGSDEFAILLQEVNHADEVLMVAERLQQDLAAPSYIKGQEIFSSFSIGIVHHDENYREASEMLRDADIAMHHAKHSGRNQIQVFNSELHARASQRLKLEGDIRHGLALNEFIPYYQPLIELKSGKVIAFEALARWKNSQRLMTPSSFIEVAEESKLIIDIDYMVLEKACRQLVLWQRQGFKDLSINANLSGHQFFQEAELISHVRAALEKSGFALLS
ncbi:MAG: bifunctional diguanylate cyclase/phosphodiesterase [Deinococcales bacterium]